MKILSIICLLSVNLSLIAQISQSLEQEIRDSDEEYFTIKVLFNSQTSILEERRKWQSQNIQVDQWPRLVNRNLMKEANLAQAGAIRLLNSVDPDQFKSVSSFYIVNMMILQATPDHHGSGHA